MYKVIVKDLDGNIFEAFTWDGVPMLAIYRCQHDALIFDQKLAEVWVVNKHNFEIEVHAIYSYTPGRQLSELVFPFEEKFDFLMLTR